MLQPDEAPRRRGGPTRARPRCEEARAACFAQGAALECDGVWHELRDGPAILRGVTLRVQPG
jgi:hypothetical protein